MKKNRPVKRNIHVQCVLNMSKELTPILRDWCVDHEIHSEESLQDNNHYGQTQGTLTSVGDDHWECQLQLSNEFLKTTVM